MVILSRRTILLAILLYEQFIHVTQINLRHNIQFLSTQQCAHQSFLVTSWFDSVCITVTRWVNVREFFFYINMSTVNSLQCMKVFSPYIILVEKYFFPIFASKLFMVKSKNLLCVIPEIHTFGTAYFHTLQFYNCSSCLC